jgi:hypothetical protein
VNLKAAAAPRRGASGIIVCVSVPPYDNAEQDKWCEANNNEGKLCGPEAWTPPGQPDCLSKTCRCADSDDVQVAPGAASVVCNGNDETYVVKEASLTEGWLTDEWCVQYCEGNDGGCPEEAVEKCKCGPKAKEEPVVLPGVDPQEAKTDKDMLICVDDRYVAANEASTDLWCAGSCVPDGCPKDAQEACKCDDDGHGEGGGPVSEGDMREVDYSCLSIDVDKTNEWCNSECGEYGKCPSAKQYCKCGTSAAKTLSPTRCSSKRKGPRWPETREITRPTRRAPPSRRARRAAASAKIAAGSDSLVRPPRSACRFVSCAAMLRYGVRAWCVGRAVFCIKPNLAIIPMTLSYLGLL